MKIHAYQKTYLNRSQALLGSAFDYAINTCKISGDKFIDMFIVSKISKHIENGEPAYISGKSGIEIVNDIVFESTNNNIEIKIPETYSRSKEYWIGWAIAYYQWYCGKSFKYIFSVLSYDYLDSLYHPLHEADITKFVDIIEEKIQSVSVDTNLKRIRKTYCCTQLELSHMSNVSLRSIQMYEQRQKDINKASVETVARLSKALGCTIEDLME